MSEFKSGDIVTACSARYMYACTHPANSDLSMVIHMGDGRVRIFDTSDLKSAPKTHKVNGFEVPAPVGKADFDEIEDTYMIYSFSCNYYDGYEGILKCHASIVAVKCGFVFRSQSDIKKNIAALQGIDPSTVE